MDYDLDAGRNLINEAGLVTIAFVFAETPGGYLRDLGWQHEGEIGIVPGEDMGARSLLHATIPPEACASVRISGIARFMDKGNPSTSFKPDLPA